MHSIEIFQVDAFTDKVFHGNPAAVCLMKDWLNDELLQAIAVENNLSETAFVIENKDGYQIRWFTPRGEIELCGHATLAAAFILFEREKKRQDILHFSSLSGPLHVQKNNDLLTMDFPRLSYTKMQTQDLLNNIVNQPCAELYDGQLDYIAVFADEADVENSIVNLNELAQLPKRGLILTAKSKRADFYSRCFYPKHNIPEDPVTGSAHCALAPLWSEKLSKKKLKGLQGSVRWGEVFCEVFETRVHISGYCKWYFQGQLVI